MTDGFERFDMNRQPVKCRWFLKPLAWAIALPGVLAHRTKITKTGTDGLRPPYLLLCNHNAFFDMKVSAMATFPRFGNYVVAIDGFIGREGLLRNLGCICKRKFTSDIRLIRRLVHVVRNGGIPVIYPEARYSLCGTPAPLPESLGKVARMLGVPVVTLICHGHHINHPFWNTRRERGVAPTEAEMKLIITAEELKTLSADEVNDRIVAEFSYDDFSWQEEKRIKVKDPQRAVGLEKILYKCPHCEEEYGMYSEGAVLGCRGCGRKWYMDEYGRLSAEDGKTEYPHIPDWYEWERECVRREVAEGRYSTGDMPVTVESLPGARGFIPIGSGTMRHDMNGFSVSVTDSDGVTRTMEKKVPSLYSCHIEYEYLFKHGDCVDLNTLDDTWYIYPHSCGFSVTKMALATEELYYDYRRKIGRPCRPGLA
ncbi:MAG: hypothetical protein IJU46_04030 [Clostridia bacterium]|nr:hypothetical protein [Clostridia bacterium]